MNSATDSLPNCSMRPGAGACRFAQRRGVAWRGKGGHMMVFVGGRLTTVPSREIDPKTARKSRKQLGLAD